MLIACGCTLSTTITVLQHREPDHAPFIEDYSRCCYSVQRHPDPYAWTWRIGWIELFNEEACREVQVWDCLESYGWQPAIQAIGPSQASEDDFRRALYECAQGTSLSGLVPPRLSGTALMAITERIYADDGILGSGRAIRSCLKQRQWRLIRGEGYLHPGGLEVSRSLILPPVIAEIADKFVPGNGSLLLDTAQGIHWRAKQPLRRPANTDEFTDFDRIDADNRGSIQDANDFITRLNRGKIEGKDDWRLPRISEVQSLANYATWSGMTVPGNTPRKILGLAWTGETDEAGTPLAVDLSNGSVHSLGTSRMYGALILPVAGHGWYAPHRTSTKD
jgi:hypothetical protein